MTTRRKPAFDLTTLHGPKPPYPAAPSPAAGPTALAVAVALLRALKERGLLSEGELDDVLADALGSLGDPAARRLLDGVRSDLERVENE